MPYLFAVFFNIIININFTAILIISIPDHGSFYNEIDQKKFIQTQLIVTFNV